MSDLHSDNATVTREETPSPRYWQKASGTTDPAVLLARFDTVRSKTEEMTIPDTTETIRRSRDSGLTRE